MESSEFEAEMMDLAEPAPAWLSDPFGPGWDSVGQHVQTILDVWASDLWHGGPVSERSEDQLDQLVETVGRMERQMRSTWTEQEWQDHQSSWVISALPPGATLATQIAHFEYLLVMGWQAQVVHAYWNHLSPDDRRHQEEEIQECLRTSRPFSTPLTTQ